jgi:hypothetical protein
MVFVPVAHTVESYRFLNTWADPTWPAIPAPVGKEICLKNLVGFGADTPDRDFSAALEGIEPVKAPGLSSFFPRRTLHP